MDVPRGTAHRCARIGKTFRELDRSGTGLLGKEELKELLLALGGAFSQQSVETILEAADYNGEGAIKFQDFLDWCFSDRAPYVILKELVADGLTCFEGHEIDQFIPEVDGWCCQECGDDLLMDRLALKCVQCGGLAWCIRCGIEQSSVGAAERRRIEEAMENEAAGREAMAAGHVDSCAREHDWPCKVKELLRRWPPPSREAITGVLAVKANIDDSDVCGQKALQTWLDGHLPPEEYVAAVELRRFLQEHDLVEALLPEVEAGAVTNVEQLRPGKILEELKRSCSPAVRQQLDAASTSVLDSAAAALAEALDWEGLIVEFSSVHQEDLFQLLLSTAGLLKPDGHVDEELSLAVSRWLEHASTSRRSGSSRGLDVGPSGCKKTTLTVPVPADAWPGEVIRVPHGDLMLPLRIPRGARPGSALLLHIPASVASQMLGVTFTVGDMVQIDLPGTDVHQLTGRVLEIQVAQARIAVQLGDRILGFAASSLRSAPLQPFPVLMRFCSGPASFATGGGLQTGTASSQATPTATASPAQHEVPADEVPPPIPPVLERQTSVAEACMGERFGAYPPHDLETGPGICAICMDEKTVMRLCETDDCMARLCEDCLSAYASNMAKECFYAMPYLRCPGCNARVQAHIWKPFVAVEDWNRYEKVGAALTEFRCGSCHQSKTLWQAYNSKASEASVFRKISPKRLEEVRSAWQQYSRARLGANDLLRCLLDGFNLEVRSGPLMPPKLPLNDILGLVVDDERRLCLQLAAVRLYPKISTFCCGASMCFGCKTAWHNGITCQAKRQAEAGKDVQFCPNCKVPAVKSEGCNHMVCVCGTHWSWQSNPKVGQLIQAVRSRSWTQLRSLGLDPATVSEAYQSLAWDNVNYVPSLPVLFETESLRSLPCLLEHWRIVCSVGRGDAAAVLREILRVWPAEQNPAQLWADACGASRAFVPRNPMDLGAILDELLAHAGQDVPFLADVWRGFLEQGEKARKAKTVSVAQVLRSVLRQGGSPCDTGLLTQVLQHTAQSNDQNVSFITVLTEILNRAGSDHMFVAAAWHAILGGSGAGLQNFKLSSAQVDEAFRLFLTRYGSSIDVLSHLLVSSSLSGHVLSIKELLERKVNPNNVVGSTPALVAAAAHGQPEAVQCLLSVGKAAVDIRISTVDDTPLHAVLRRVASFEEACNVNGEAEQRPIKVSYSDTRDNPGVGRDLTWQPRPQKPAALGGGRGGGRGGSKLLPAGAYQLGGTPLHPAVVHSVRPEQTAAKATVKPGDILVSVRDKSSKERSEAEIAKGNLDQLLKRLAPPATLVFQRGLKARLAAVESDWQARFLVVDLLCSAKADVHAPIRGIDGESGVSPLLAASRAGVGGIVTTLLQHGAAGEIPVEPSDRRGWLATEVRAACRGGHTSVVERLLNYRADPDPVSDWHDLSPLLLTARGLRTDKGLWAPELLQTSEQDRLQKFPVLEIDWTSRVMIAKRLCAARADVDGCIASSKSPLFWAAEAGCMEMVQLLIEQGGKLRGDGLLALQRAAAGARLSDVQLLLRMRADPDADPGSAKIAPVASPLSAAATGTLVSKSETVESRRKRLSEWASRLEIARCLVQARADVGKVSCGTPVDSTENNPGFLPPLFAAAKTGSREMVSLLLEHRADPNSAHAENNDDIILGCVKQLLRWPKDFESDEQEVEYIEPSPPMWFNRWQREQWQVAQWRKYRNERVARREKRQKRLRLERAAHDADTAARKGIVQTLLRAGTLPGKGRHSVIREAAQRGSTAVVAALLQLGKTPDSCIEWCPACGRPQLLRERPQEGATQAFCECECGSSWPVARSPLHSLVAAAQGELLHDALALDTDLANLVKQMWQHGADMLRGHGLDCLPRCAPCWGGNDCCSVLAALVKLQADVNCRLLDGATMLHVACEVGHVEVTDRLLELKANLNLPSPSLLMPLQLVAQGHRDRNGCPWDLALKVAASCGGEKRLPRDIERTLLYNEAPLGGLTLDMSDPQKVPAGKARAKSPAARRGSRAPSPAPSPVARRGSRASSPAPARNPESGKNSCKIYGAKDVLGLRVQEVDSTYRAARVGIIPGDLLVSVCEVERGSDDLSDGFEAQGRALTGAPKRVFERARFPLELTFRAPTCTYTYEESALNSLVFVTSEHGHLRVHGLLITPGLDSEPGGDADRERCANVMGKVIGCIDGEDVTRLAPAEVRKRLGSKGLSLTFLSPIGEVSAACVRDAERRQAIVQRLCAARVDPNAASQDEAQLPLILAARAGQVGVVLALIAAGSDQLEPALCAACEVGDAGTAELLLTKSASPNGHTEMAATSPLLLAARGCARLTSHQWANWRPEARESVELAALRAEESERKTICRQLVACRADPDRANGDGHAAMHWATAAGFLEITRLLLHLGASAQPQRLPWTPLHSLCSAMPANALALSSLLLAQNAQADPRDAEGVVPLLCVARGFLPPAAPRSHCSADEDLRFALIELLLRRGADLTRTIPESCLHAVIRLSAKVPCADGHCWPVPARLLALQAPADGKDASGRSPLHVAIESGANDAVDVLMSSGAPLDLNDPLIAAVTNGNTELVSRLLERHADPNFIDAQGGFAPLHVAAKGAQATMQKLLIDARADVHLRDAEGATPLFLLASTESPDSSEDVNARNAMAKELIHYLAEVDVICNSQTPLFAAARKNRPGIVRVLLDKGANFTAGDTETGGGLLHFIVRLGNEAMPAEKMREMIFDLVRKGVKVNAADKLGRTPMHYAALAGWPDAMLTLTTNKASVDTKDKAGLVPLHLVAQSDVDVGRAREVMRYLVDPRISGQVDVADKLGCTPLHHAAEHSQLGFLSALLAMRASIDAADYEGRTPLHLAVKTEGEQAAQVLLAAGASTVVRDASGHMPIQHATSEGLRQLLAGIEEA